MLVWWRRLLLGRANMKARWCVAWVCAMLAGATASQSAVVVYFDFGSAGFTTAGHWNNVTDPTALGPKVINAVDSTGAPTTIDLYLTDNFSSINTSGTTSPDPGLGYPASATRDSFYGDGGNVLGMFVVGGLTLGQGYKFTYFASRLGDSNSRVASYQTIGLGGSSSTVLLDATGNTSLKVTSASIEPNETGDVTIKVTDGGGASQYFLLGVLEITTTDDPPIGVVPEPSSIGLLALGALAARQLRKRIRR